jgi:hypothetical protein
MMVEPPLSQMWWRAACRSISRLNRRTGTVVPDLDRYDHGVEGLD